jgi:hypothetical protein
MYITLCDECHTLATVSVVGDTIELIQCACVQLSTTTQNN